MEREDKKQNDLFFVCSLIEYIGRATHNYRKYVVNALGKEELEHIYEFADVYHCENMDKLVAEFSQIHNIKEGDYDNVSLSEYRVPTAWEIGRVMQRLVIHVAEDEKLDVPDAIIKLYNSWMPEAIGDYNSSFYYDSPGYQYASYRAGKPI
ncbi:MAG: hypothetical protein MJZ15_09960 [Bacteroidales bacterium]|nr:hypothetical protein [Bacteroidales bacterium]